MFPGEFPGDVPLAVGVCLRKLAAKAAKAAKAAMARVGLPDYIRARRARGARLARQPCAARSLIWPCRRRQHGRRCGGCGRRATACEGGGSQFEDASSHIRAWLLSVVGGRLPTYLHVGARRCGARRQVTLSLCLNGHHTPQTMSKGTQACAMWVCPRVQGTERLCE